jgi:hypothetical protein
MSAPRFDGERMTKREVLIARKAYKDGAAAERGHAHDDAGWKPAAEARYPLPKVTRPRVVRDQHNPAQEWIVEDGFLRCRNAGGAWMKWAEYKLSADFAPLPERVALWADLLANPTEEVNE